MWVSVHEDKTTLATAVVGLVSLWGYNPLPTEGFKVYGQWVATAADFGAFIVAVFRCM